MLARLLARGQRKRQIHASRPTLRRWNPPRPPIRRTVHVRIAQIEEGSPQKLLSSGVVEGLNNKAKLTMRKSYGFRTFRCLELALYHSLGKLPEPESTHEFF